MNELCSNVTRFPDENPNPVIQIDAAGALIYANLSGKEIINILFGDSYVVEQAVFELDYAEILRSGTPHNAEVKCGDKIYAMTFAPLVECRNINIYGLDITALKKVEYILKLNNKRLLQSNAELEQFAYIASHDLQEPLRMVASYTQLLAEKYRGRLDEKADKYIDYAVDGATRMQGLINDLLNFSRIGAHECDFANTDCEIVVSRTLEVLHKEICSSGATIDKGVMPVVSGDENLLIQVFQNLIGNAIKYRGKQEPVIEISAVRNGIYWEFKIKDNGIGINPKYHGRIFTIFQRLHGVSEYPGTGIGLAVAKKIVERHGGRIRVESEDGEGASFIFTLLAVD